jgi:predicted RND superfamily exporter protein
MRPDASIAGMFPKDDPAATSLVRVLDRFSAVEELLVLVSVPEDQWKSPPDTRRLLAFARRLDQAVHDSPEASSLTAGVLYQADPGTRAFFEKVLVPNALFYLDDAGFDAACQRLTRPEMVKQIRQNEAMVAAPGPAAQALAKAFLQDPLRLREFLTARLTATRPFKTYGNSDAFLSPDGHSLLIRIRGKRPPGDIDFSTAITRTIRSLADRSNTDGLRVELTGAYAIAAASATSIRHDMIWNVISSVVLLQLLFVVAYRRPFRSFLLAFGPVAAGIVWGLGTYLVGSPTVTPLTAVVGGILAGMGIDYTVHFLAHYMAARASEDVSAADAAAETGRTLAGPMFAAWLTSVIGFAAVASSSVPALRRFAVIGALGLAGTFVGAMAFLPAVLVLLGRRSPTAGARLRLDITPLLTFIAHHRKGSIGLCVAVLAAAVLVLARPGDVFPLESDLTVMHPSPNPALDAQSHVAERMGSAADSLLVHLRADRPEHLVTLAHAAADRLSSPAARDAGVTGTYGLSTLLPDPAVAPRRLAATGPAVADRVVADFRAAVADSIFAPDAFDPYAGFLRHLLTRPAPPTLSDLLDYRPLAQTILPASAVETHSLPTEAITLVFVKDPLSTRTDRQRVITALRTALADLPGATVTGMSVVASDTEAAVRRDLPRFLWIAVAAVAAYLLAHFRAVAPAILAVVPTLFSLTCQLAVMRLTGQHLNMVNLVSVPILIGIDVDYGIFLVSLARQRRAAGESLPHLIARVAPSCHAIILCAATTVLGFGSLAFTSVPAIRSLGLAVGVGVSACLAGTFLLLLPILARDTRPEDATP